MALNGKTFCCWGYFCRDGEAAGTGKDDPKETSQASLHTRNGP